jgi:hypothetical protein
MARLALSLGLLLLAGTPALAEGAAPEPEAEPRWQFSLAPYFWAAGLEGTLEAERVSADIDVSFSDIWDALDLGVLGSFEARRGKLSLASNLIYLKLSEEAERPVSPLLPVAPPGSFTVRTVTQEAIFEFRPAWETLSLAPFGDERRVALDLGPAARVFWLDEHLHAALRPGVPVGPFSRRLDESTDWVDFLAAARVRAQLSERIGLVVFGDYGGFDIGSSSHRTWSLGGYFAYRLGEHWDLGLGWRTLELERGAVDLEMAGPLVGAMYRF